MVLAGNFGIRKHRRYPMMQCLECERKRDQARLELDKQDRRERRILRGWGDVLVPGALSNRCEWQKCDRHDQCKMEVARGLTLFCECIHEHDILTARLMDVDLLDGTNFIARITTLAPDMLPYLA